MSACAVKCLILHLGTVSISFFLPAGGYRGGGVLVMSQRGHSLCELESHSSETPEDGAIRWELLVHSVTLTLWWANTLTAGWRDISFKTPQWKIILISKADADGFDWLTRCSYVYRRNSFILELENLVISCQIILRPKVNAQQPS